MEPAAQRLEDAVAQAAAISEQEWVRRHKARRAAGDAEDWMHAVATPVVKRRGGARRGGPFSRGVASRLTIACLGEQ
ncbi:hypothetical protein HYH02_014652 [Chlamydomonas schloesseri]|uniref:Uncharacterized protein n=1 Tax=Chlamydomonas schloesseri TaxID=2026947 RepID=A0A835SK29_9CHLO|nr:hypothetical protein HYH02_014652 [Chlamydomonas schloesseri]|eukprot:KAG2427006.1 hypothetical protein HYH02_014652 [Chlamydomonas schloesseri]